MLRVISFDKVCASPLIVPDGVPLHTCQPHRYYIRWIRQNEDGETVLSVDGGDCPLHISRETYRPLASFWLSDFTKGHLVVGEFTQDQGFIPFIPDALLPRAERRS